MVTEGEGTGSEEEGTVRESRQSETGPNLTWARWTVRLENLGRCTTDRRVRHGRHLPLRQKCRRMINAIITSASETKSSMRTSIVNGRVHAQPPDGAQMARLPNAWHSPRSLSILHCIRAARVLLSGVVVHDGGEGGLRGPRRQQERCHATHERARDVPLHALQLPFEAMFDGLQVGSADASSVRGGERLAQRLRRSL